MRKWRTRHFPLPNDLTKKDTERVLCDTVEQEPCCIVTPLQVMQTAIDAGADISLLPPVDKASSQDALH